MMNPLVSVVIPCYNHEHYIQQCIQSVLNQRYENIELIVIDDGSKDRSFEKIQAMEALCRERLVNFEFRQRENKGLCATLNEALSLCQGEYVSPIASDDFMLSEKLATQVEYAVAHPEVSSFYAGVQLIDEAGQFQERIELPLQIYSFDDIFMHNFVLYAPTQMHRLKDIQEIGGFNEHTKIEDWELWLRLTKHNKKILCLPEVLAAYRLHDSNMSKDNDLMLQELLKIMQHYKNDPLFKKARFKVIKQYKLRPLKDLSRLKYYQAKILYWLQNQWA